MLVARRDQKTEVAGKSALPHGKEIIAREPGFGKQHARRQKPLLPRQKRALQIGGPGLVHTHMQHQMPPARGRPPRGEDGRGSGTVAATVDPCDGGGKIAVPQGAVDLKEIPPPHGEPAGRHANARHLFDHRIIKDLLAKAIVAQKSRDAAAQIGVAFGLGLCLWRCQRACHTGQQIQIPDQARDGVEHLAPQKARRHIGLRGMGAHMAQAFFQKLDLQPMQKEIGFGDRNRACTPPPDADRFAQTGNPLGRGDTLQDKQTVFEFDLFFIKAQIARGQKIAPIDRRPRRGDELRLFHAAQPCPDLGFGKQHLVARQEGERGRADVTEAAIGMGDIGPGPFRIGQLRGKTGGKVIIIGIEKGDAARLGRGKAGVARRRQAQILRVVQHAHTGGQAHAGKISRAELRGIVVHDKNVDAIKALRQNGIQRQTDEGGFIVKGDDDGKAGIRHIGPPGYRLSGVSADSVSVEVENPAPKAPRTPNKSIRISTIRTHTT